MEDYPVQFWHYLIILMGFFVLGVFSHYFRAIVNFLPDRFSDSKNLDMFVSGGYSLMDRVLETEYDEAGYYRGDSAKNLRNATVLCFVVCLIALGAIPPLDNLLANFIDLGLVQLNELFFYRLANTEFL